MFDPGMDEAVLDALGMAMAFQGISGPPPSELLRRLKQGPGGHLRSYASRIANTGKGGGILVSNTQK